MMKEGVTSLLILLTIKIWSKFLGFLKNLHRFYWRLYQSSPHNKGATILEKNFVRRRQALASKLARASCSSYISYNTSDRAWELGPKNIAFFAFDIYCCFIPHGLFSKANPIYLYKLYSFKLLSIFVTRFSDMHLQGLDEVVCILYFVVLYNVVFFAYLTYRVVCLSKHVTCVC